MSTKLTISFITLTLVSLKRQLIHEKTVSRDRWLDCYDFIVVGSGAAGAVVAHRLAESGAHTVLLLEAGGAQNAIWTDIPALTPTDNRRLIWPYYNEPQANTSLAYRGHRSTNFMGKVLGGSSSVNSMAYLRGSRFDFDNMANTYGAEGWSYADVLPLFIKTENNSDWKLVAENPGYHGTGGPIGVTSQTTIEPIFSLLRQQYNRLGFETVDLNGAQQLGTAFNQWTTKEGLRSGTGNAYLDPNPFPNNLHILAESHVTRVLFNRTESGITASAVEFVRDGVYRRVSAEKEIIVSAGAVNSAQLLMLSGIGPKGHLESHGIRVLADLPVGDHYVNHVIIFIAVAINRKGLFNWRPELNVQQLSQLYYNHSGPLSTPGPRVIAYESSTGNPYKQWPDVFTMTTSASAVNGTVILFDNHYENPTQYERYFAFSEDKDILLMQPTLARPKSTGTIRLASSDPFVYPLQDPQYLTHPQDMEAMVEAVRNVFFRLTATPFAQHVTFPPLPVPGCRFCPDRPVHKCNTYIRCYIRQLAYTMHHSMGTCRMGAANRMDVVVDPRCRVKHVSGLRVADSSLFSEPINANTYAPTVVVGEKCSLMIREDWREWDEVKREVKPTEHMINKF